MSSKAASKLAKVRLDRDRLFSEGKYYEALQLYKTLHSRAIARKAVEEAEEIAVEGATALLQQKQANSGGELALAVIQLYVKANRPCDEQTASHNTNHHMQRW